MSDASNAAPAANEKPKLSKSEKLAAREAKKFEREAKKAEREAKKAEREAKKAEKAEAKKVEGTQKKAEGWERKGRNSKGQKAYDFNSKQANGDFLPFGEYDRELSRRKKGVYKEAIARDMDTGNAVRRRSWAGGIKQKTEDTVERINPETGKREDVRIRKEKEILAWSKNVDYKENGAKLLERGTRKGTFTFSYTNNPDGSRSFNGFKIGPLKIHREKGENGEKSFGMSFGKSLYYLTSTEANGNKTRKYNINNIYSSSKSENSNGDLVHSEKTYFGKRTKTFEKTAEGSLKFTTKGRSVDEMKVDGLNESDIQKEIDRAVLEGKVYRLKRTNERGEVTRDYNRQTYKGKFLDYNAGDEKTSASLRQSSGWGFDKLNRTSLSREEIAVLNERKAQLEVQSITSAMPGAFPSELNEQDKRITRNSSVSSRVAQLNEAEDAKGADAKSVSSAASSKGSVASFSTAATSKTSASVASNLSTATTETANSSKLKARLDERMKSREARGLGG
jgi:hypothetical protein